MNNFMYVPRPRRLTETLHSMLRSPDIDTGTIESVLAHYEFELAGKPRNLPNTRRNLNLVVDTTAGKAIFKLYRADWRSSTIQFEHAVLQKLRELQFPAPLPLQTRGNQTYVTHQGRHYALFGFLGGRNFSSGFLIRSQRLRLMELAGQRLAALHKTLSGFQPPAEHHLGFTSYTGNRKHDREWHRQKLAVLKAGSATLPDEEQRGLSSWLVDHADWIVQKMDSLDESLEKEGLPRAVIHGDYGLHNLLISRDGTVIPVDFELARLEWRLSDLVSCLSRVRLKDKTYDQQSIRRFLLGYQSEYPLLPKEMQAFPRVWQFYKLKSAIQYWSSFFETQGPTRKLYSAKDAVKQADWAAAKPEIIQSWVARG